MAKRNNKRIVGIKSSTLANFYGALFALVGLVVAILHSLRSSVDVAQETQSVLSGLVFGLAAGFVAVIIVPLIYYAIGWVIGYFHGFIFNVVAESSEGLVLRIVDSDDD
jgi:uncharacterized membrane protein